ncbi:tyrosine phosphatase-like protein [Blyttiomyces helicus]|uniref:Very-long-chain (3R)-3-hydroxyacyl-CoA dehydratase n=1 Tax=Blyttiomyces helicus TaxID=388810 RepID=A0A4P9WRG4_9FUNG|nr:tyrosine phosphatase-like protein [Blyttiomyces helicus]|eukprot:RKO93860.1 tyrosine phosphatase-like protein [Blyttiomyces helicus]
MPEKKPTPKQKGSLSPLKIWLIFYNVGSAAAWAFVLALLVKSLVLTGGDWTKSFKTCGWEVTVVQTGALVEVSSLVKTPVTTTIMQVSSRILLVWGVCYPFNAPEVRENWAFSTMVAAWGITEVVRYLYYALNLVGSQPAWLLWCRYNFFFVLYPVGAGSEWILLLKALTPAYKMDPNLAYVFATIAILYPPGLKNMYTYMMAQRRKYLKGASTAPKKQE